MSRALPRALATWLLLVLAAVGLGQTAMDAKAKQDVLDRLQDVMLHTAFVPGVDFSKWPTFVEKNRSDIDKAETDEAFARELNVVLRLFGVSHFRLRAPRAAEARRTGTTSGTGIVVRKTDAGLEVTSVFPMSSAGQAGIEVGDVIKEVEGKTPVDAGSLRVESGKTLVVKVLKKNGETKDLTLENKEFSTRRPEALTWLADDAAMLRVYTFANGYDRKNIESLIGEVDKKAKYLVIDLRSNGGGAVSNLNHFLSMLMPDSTSIGTFVSRTSADEYAKEKGQPGTDPVVIADWTKRKFKTNKRDVEPFQGRIAVLINRGSASASEICSAALRENRDAILVGVKSAGAVLASTYRSLGSGFELQFPVQDYVTIKGTRLEGHPLEPDLVVERGTDGKDDAPTKALELLKKKATEHTNAGSSGTGHGHRQAA